MFLVLLLSLTIASVPVFSYQQGLSIIPQYIAIFAVGITLVSLAWRAQLPSIHPAMMAYIGLMVFFGLTFIWHQRDWETYKTLLKICLLSLAIHVTIRSPRQLLVVFGLYSVMAAVTVLLNLDELRNLKEVIEAESPKERFAGTFANANTAGLYGIMAILGALIVYANLKHWVRWPVLLVGITAGAAITYFTGSRKAMLGALLISIALPWLGWQPARDKGSTGGRMLLMTVLLLLALLLLPHLPHSDRLLNMLGEEGVRADESSATRYAMALKAVELWSKSPLWGCGYDGFSTLSGFNGYSHSTFTEVLCNGGLVGSVLIGMFYLWPVKDLVRNLRRSSEGRRERTLEISLLAFWGNFTLFSVFAVMFDSRDYIPICAAICGYLQDKRRRSPVAFEGSRSGNRIRNKAVKTENYGRGV